MSSPAIQTVNQVKFRVVRAAKDWEEALALVRRAATAPGYSGPPLEVVERMAVVIAEIRAQVHAWSLEEQRRRASRPRRATCGQSRTVRTAIAELYGR
jgi:hypothetical protein